MTRITFSTRPSSFFLAVTTHKHLDKFKEKYPAAATQLRKGIYVDDVLLGANDYSTSAKLYKEARDIFRSAGMNLRKWTTKDTELRKLFDEGGEYLDPGIRKDGQIKGSGLKWNFIDEVLSFPDTKWRKDMDTRQISKQQVLHKLRQGYTTLLVF